MPIKWYIRPMGLGASALLGRVSDSRQVPPCPNTLTPHLSSSLSASPFLLLSKIGLDFLFPSPFSFFESHRFTSRGEMLRKGVEHPVCILLGNRVVFEVSQLPVAAMEDSRTGSHEGKGTGRYRKNMLSALCVSELVSAETYSP